MPTAKATGKRARPRFVRAANVELDLTERKVLDGYVLTSTGRTALRRMSSAVTGDSHSRAWTLTGPYGTGKSAFAVFTASLLDDQSTDTKKRARDLLNSADPELASLLGTKGRSAGNGLIPIPITGTREPVEGAVLRGLQTSVSSRLNGTGKTLTAELTKARKQIANGKSIGSRRVTELVSDGVDRLCRKSRGANGVFLVLDELGKLLEYANHHSSTSDLFTLQELAEHFSRSDHRCLLMGILHQDFGAYATRLSSQERAEWNKVRGRFEDIAFHEPAEEMLRLIAGAMSVSGIKPPARTVGLIRKLADRTWKLGLAPGSMTKSEFISILEHCAPLHPVVAVSIGTVFQRLAQNERSAFSFLSSNEPFGLGEFARSGDSRKSGLYGMDRLYDYLIHSIRDSLYASPQSKLWAEAESILSSLNEGSASDVFLIKAIGLINAIARDERMRSSREVIALASDGCLSSPAKKAEIDGLVKRRIIVDRKFNQTLALWEGSDVDLDEEIKKARGQIGDDLPVSELATRYFHPSPIVARRHTFTTGNFRFFHLRFASADELTNSPVDDHLVIHLALPETQADESRVRRAAKDDRIAGQPGHLVCVPEERQEFAAGIRDLSCLEWVRQNVKALEGDRAARRELSIRIEGITARLNDQLTQFLAPQSHPRLTTWYHQGAPLKIEGRSGLQDELSRICDEVFPKAPHIRNELINRSQLSSAAAKARRNLFERMFSSRTESELGLEKAPPEKSVYLSVLHRAGLHAETDEGWDFKAPRGRNPLRINETWKAITAFFKKTEAGARPVSELFETLSAPPYGVLEGPMPLIFCAALQVHDDEIALYKDGTFIPAPSDPDFELLVKDPTRYTVQRWHVSGVRATVFEKLVKLLGRDFTGDESVKGQILNLVKPLLRFYKGLNTFALNTRDLSDEASAIREALAKQNEPDSLLFVDLPKAVGLKPFSKTQKASTKQVKQFIDRLRTGLVELQTAYDRLLASVLSSLRTAFSEKGELSAVRDSLRSRASGLSDCSGDPALKSFVSRLCELTYEDDEWLEMLASQVVMSLPSNWKDGDLKRFQSELRSIARVFRHVEAIAFDPSRKRNSAESLRIGVTLADATESERVVHLNAKQQAAVDKAEHTLESELRKIASNPHIALAALARVAQRRLSK